MKKWFLVYVNVFVVLLFLLKVRFDEKFLVEFLVFGEDDLDDLVVFDCIWEDEVVIFGGNVGEGVCGFDCLCM